MKYTIIVSDKASDMLQRHIAFIANVSKKATRDQKKEIVDAIKRLKEDANIYPFFENEFIPKNKYHKYVISKRYIILYQIKDDVVYVDYIIDTRQDYSWLL